MAVLTESVYEYQNNEAADLRSAFRLLRERVSQLSLTQLRNLICSATNGSYAELSRFLQQGELEEIRMRAADVRRFLDITNGLSAFLSERDVRLLRTWSKAMLKDLRHFDQESGERFDFEKTRSLA